MVYQTGMFTLQDVIDEQGLNQLTCSFVGHQLFGPDGKDH